MAHDTPRGLITHHAPTTRVIFSTAEIELDWLAAVPGVSRVDRHGLRVIVEGGGPLLALVAAALVEHDIVPGDLRVEEPTLEEAFLELTGHMVEE